MAFRLRLPPRCTFIVYLHVCFGTNTRSAGAGAAIASSSSIINAIIVSSVGIQCYLPKAFNERVKMHVAVLVDNELTLYVIVYPLPPPRKMQPRKCL